MTKDMATKLTGSVKKSVQPKIMATKLTPFQRFLMRHTKKKQAKKTQ